MGIDLLPAIQLGRIEPTERYGPLVSTPTLRGTFARNKLSLGKLVCRARPGMKANGRRSFRLPRNPAGHMSTTTTRKHTRVPSSKGTQKKTNQKQEQESRKGQRGLTGSRRENGESYLMASSWWALTLSLYRTPRGEIRV